MSLEYQKTSRRIDELESRLVQRLDNLDTLISTLVNRIAVLEEVSQNYRRDILSEAHDSIQGVVLAAVDAAKNELKEVVHNALPTDEAPSDAAVVIPTLLSQAPAVVVEEAVEPEFPETTEDVEAAEEAVEDAADEVADEEEDA